MKVCEYGCGQQATYKFKNGKWCCSSNQMKCPAIIEKWKLDYDHDKNRSFKKVNCQFCQKILRVANKKQHETSCYLNPNNLRLCPSCKDPIKNKDNTYCSKRCSSSIERKQKHSHTTRNKISIAMKKRWRKGPHISKEKLKTITKKAIEKQKQNREKLYKYGNWEELPLTYKRRKVLEEQDGKCAICKIGEWQGQSLTLHFDHIDGNSKNDSRENVRFLCPNCHSQTETYCGNKQNLPQFEYLKVIK